MTKNETKGKGKGKGKAEVETKPVSGDISEKLYAAFISDVANNRQTAPEVKEGILGFLETARNVETAAREAGLSPIGQQHAVFQAFGRANRLSETLGKPLGFSQVKPADYSAEMAETLRGDYVKAAKPWQGVATILRAHIMASLKRQGRKLGVDLGL